MKFTEKTRKTAVLAAAITLGSVIMLHAVTRKVIIPYAEEDYMTFKSAEITESIQDSETAEEERRLEEERKAQEEARAAEQAREDLLERMDTVTAGKEEIRSLYKNGKLKKKKVSTGVNAYLQSDEILLIIAGRTEKIPYDRYYYYKDGTPWYISYDGDDAWTYYLENDQLIAVKYQETAGEGEPQLYNAEECRHSWLQVPETARNYLTTAYTTIKKANLEATAVKQEKKDIKASAGTVETITREESVAKAPKSEKKQTASAKDTSAKDTSAKDTSANNTSANNTSAKDTSAKNTSAKSTSSADASAEEVLPESSKRKYKKSELSGLTKEELQLAINELYARNGYKFKKTELTAHFKQFSWYKPDTSDAATAEGRFNEYEQANMKLIRDYQKEKGY